MAAALSYRILHQNQTPFLEDHVESRRFGNSTNTVNSYVVLLSAYHIIWKNVLVPYLHLLVRVLVRCRDNTPISRDIGQEGMKGR